MGIPINEGWTCARCNASINASVDGQQITLEQHKCSEKSEQHMSACLDAYLLLKEYADMLDEKRIEGEEGIIDEKIDKILTTAYALTEGRNCK